MATIRLHFIVFWLIYIHSYILFGYICNNKDKYIKIHMTKTRRRFIWEPRVKPFPGISLIGQFDFSMSMPVIVYKQSPIYVFHTWLRG